MQVKIEVSSEHTPPRAVIKHERENPGFQSGDESEFLVPPYVFVE